MGPYQDGWSDCTEAAIKEIDEIIKGCDPEFLSERCLMQLAGGIANMLREMPVPPEPSPWRPIAEAPKDGTLVDLWASGSRWIDCQYSFVGKMWQSKNGVYTLPDATRFMLSPPGPEGE